MLIALDYDFTYTEDPSLWDSFIDLATSKGHSIICVTMRYENEGIILKRTIGKKCEIVFTGRKAKLNFLKELNIEPDVWIDDTPKWIYEDA
ncbi:MAG: hypothetical protein ACFFG0_01270 [Candidatus Thorarchaeota archaeon]